MSPEEAVLWLQTNVKSFPSNKDVLNALKRKVRGLKTCSIGSLPLQFGDNFTAKLLTADVKLIEEEEINDDVILTETCQHSLLLKPRQSGTIVEQFMNTVFLFRNESYIYSEILPLLCDAACERNSKKKILEETISLFPKYFFTSEEMIVLENLSPLGYKLGPRASLDENHCTLAIKALAKFHALSYSYQEQSGEEFTRLVTSRIEETCFQEGDLRHLFIQAGVMKSIELLCESKPEVAEKYHEEIEKLKIKATDVMSFMKELAVDDGNFTALCHGDFNRNNIMFSYLGDQPRDIKFVDFQVVRCCSPAIDLSFLIFLNTTPQLRKTHWEHFHDLYFTTVIEAMQEFLGADVPSKYTKESFDEDFRKKGVYGFLIAAFFLRIVLEKPENMKDPEEMATSGEDIANQMKGFLDEYMKYGGCEADERIVDALEYVLKYGLVQ